MIVSYDIPTKGAKERYVADGWKLYPELSESTGYTWIIDIIDYFSMFMGSFPVKENNAENALIAIKEFCYYVGAPKILQTDNGLEYNTFIGVIKRIKKFVHLILKIHLCINI